MDKYDVFFSFLFFSFLMFVAVMIIIIAGIISDSKNDEINDNCCTCCNYCIEESGKE